MGGSTMTRVIDIDRLDTDEVQSDTGTFRLTGYERFFPSALCPEDYNSWPRDQQGGGRRRASDGGRGRECKLHRGGC
jgi:hypothetical protein